MPFPARQGAIRLGQQVESHPDHANLILARLARRRAGIVSYAEALAAGVSRQALEHRRATGAIHLVHRNVYAVGHDDLSDEGWWHAALTACGEGGAISHVSAARRWRLLPDADLHPVHVTVPRESGPRRRPGISAHRPLDFHPLDVTSIGLLRVTTVPRAVLDLAPGLDRRTLALVLHRARVEQRMSLGALRAAMARAPRARGLRKLHSVAFGDATGPNRRERRFLALIRDAGLPAPQTNEFVETDAGSFLVDCLWQEQKLVYEIDDILSHGTAKAFVDDRRRDAALGDAGYRVRRVTDEDLWNEARSTIARLTRQLGCV
jgi:hypothetical protein